MRATKLAILGLLTAGNMATVASPNIAATTSDDPLSHLAGRWVGQAKMTHLSGSSSTFKCIVTYLPRRDGPGLKQNLRCDDGASFKLHAATLLEVSGSDVTGRWEDKINEIDGVVKGAITADGFDVQLAGRFFAARMAVSGSGCGQTVSVIPAQSEVFRELAAELHKC